MAFVQPPIGDAELNNLAACINHHFSVMQIPKNRDTVKAFMTGRGTINDWEEQYRQTVTLIEKQPDYFNVIDMIIDVVMTFDGTYL